MSMSSNGSDRLAIPSEALHATGVLSSFLQETGGVLFQEYFSEVRFGKFCMRPNEPCT